jgi:hypothetical protein
MQIVEIFEHTVPSGFFNKSGVDGLYWLFGIPAGNQGKCE